MQKDRSRKRALLTPPDIAARPRLALIILAVLFAWGTTGYVVIERWPWWDAFYMTVITVTTVGYREVRELSRAGQVFTAALLIVGVSAVLYTFSLLMAFVVEGDLRRGWAERRRARMLDTLDQHFIVCGYGRIGSIIAEEFRRQGTPFVVVERDPERVTAAIAEGTIAVSADASNEEVLKRVGIGRARGLIAAVGSDAENVYAVFTARLLRPDLFIIGRAESEDARRKLLRAGADRVISPYLIGGQQIAQTALRPAVVDFVQLATSSDNLELMMEQVRIEEGSPLGGQTLLAANLRQRFGVVVVAIQRPDGRMDFNPAPDAAMRAGDRLVVLGRTNAMKELEAAARLG